MLKNSYALDLDYNCYTVNSDFMKYIFKEKEINYILENKEVRGKEDNGEVVLYDHKFLYLIPRDFIDKFKLSREEKISLLNDIGNIRVKDITSENIKVISFLIHYAPFFMTDYEDAEVVAYQAPMNVLFRSVPFSQRMFYFTEEAQSRKNDFMRTEKELKKRFSIDTQDKVNLSGGAKSILKGDESLGNFYEGLLNLSKGPGSSQTKQVPTLIPPAMPTPEPPNQGIYEPNRMTGDSIDINGDGKGDADINNIVKGAGRLDGVATNIYLSEKLIGTEEAMVCIEVPYYAYLNGANIDMKNILMDFDKKNPGILDYKSPIEEDKTLVAKAQNWHRFFKHENLLFDADSPYQPGDVLFIKPKEISLENSLFYANDPTHSAIVTKVDEQGNPVEVMGASWDTGTVKYYDWEQWKEATKDYIDLGHGGFRPPEYYSDPMARPTPLIPQNQYEEPVPQPAPTPEE